VPSTGDGDKGLGRLWVTPGQSGKETHIENIRQIHLLSDGENGEQDIQHKEDSRRQVGCSSSIILCIPNTIKILNFLISAG